MDPTDPASLPSPRTDTSAQRVSSAERMLVHPAGRLAVGLVTFAASLAIGVPVVGAMFITIGALLVFRHAAGRVIRGHIESGRFGAYLALVEVVERSALLRRTRGRARLARVTGLVSAGRLEEAKELLRTVDADAFGGGEGLVDLHRAVLYLRLGAAEDAQAQLEAIDPASLTPPWQATLRLGLATCHVILDDLPRAREELDRLDALSSAGGFTPVSQGLRARIASWEGEGETALERSRQAIALLPQGSPLMPGLVVWHAAILLETGGDPARALALVASIAAQWTDMGAATQAEFHWVAAEGHAAAGRLQEARAHLERARSLPASRRVAARIEALAQRIQEPEGQGSGRASGSGAESVPTPCPPPAPARPPR